MRNSILALAAFFALIAQAQAGDTFNAPGGKICIDPHYDYQASYLKGSDNDVVAHQTLGRDHRELKISTTCHNLRDALIIRLSSPFSCVAMGDDVLSSTIDGRHQTCRVTRVAPYAAAPG